METDTALVGTNGIVMLNPIAHIRADIALIIDPCHTKLIDPIRNTQTLDEIHFIKFRMLVVFLLYCAQYFFYCLMIFRFIRESSF